MSGGITAPDKRGGAEVGDNGAFETTIPEAVVTRGPWLASALALVRVRLWLYGRYRCSSNSQNGENPRGP